ncbi:MAG: glycoside hydrolase family 31 protein, partial [Nitrososphaerota archaeon]
LFFDFPEDPNTYNVEDEYMFGSDILVAPVYERGVKSRQVYVPKGTRWVDAWTEEVYEGGRWIEQETPLEITPVYLREGTKVRIR